MQTASAALVEMLDIFEKAIPKHAQNNNNQHEQKNHENDNPWFDTV
jgi:hypothetical protein